MIAWTLTDIENALRESWAADTCSPDDAARASWGPDNPAWGHCDITAIVVHDLLGGDVVVGHVWSGDERHGFHWWNRLPGGVEVDLTREQFRNGQRVVPVRFVERPTGRLRRRWHEYLALRERVSRRLGTLPGPPPVEPVRAALDLDGRKLSYLDFGGPGRVLLALHGHFEEARTFGHLARELAPEWRVIAPDQRGCGMSDRVAAGHPADPDGFVADVEAVLDRVAGDRAVLLGHGPGGVHAYRLAARRPEAVDALAVVDAGAEVHEDLSFSLAWPERSPTRVALIEALGEWAPRARDAIREYADGWGPAVDPHDTHAAQRAVDGDHWGWWSASTCPALVVRGADSAAPTAALAKAMAARRPHTYVAELASGHIEPRRFAGLLREFLVTRDP